MARLLPRCHGRQKPGGDGEIRTGQFEQVSFMIKNKEEYAFTAGWGWAQWTGPSSNRLGPMPALRGTVSRATLAGCSTTSPRVLTILNSGAALTATGAGDPLNWSVIT